MGIWYIIGLHLRELICISSLTATHVKEVI